MPTSKNFIKIPKTKIPYPFSKKNGKNRLNTTIKTIAVYILIGLAVLILLGGFSGNTQTGSEIPLSQVINEIKEDKVEKISLEGDKIKVDYRGEEKDAISRKEAGESIYKVLESAGVDPGKVSIAITDISWKDNWISVIGTVLPILLMVAFFFFIFRQAKDGAQGIFSFGQSRARLFTKDAPQIKFSDVAGVDEAKKELEEVVDFLKNPGKYKEIGARTPKGVLLVGPPGTGKCVTGDTIVWTNKGLMEIADIPKYYYVDQKTNFVFGAGLASFNTDDVISEDRFASHWFDMGEQETVKAQLAQGFEIEGTPEHPVVVMGEDGKLKFRRLDQIKENDYVAIQYGRNFFGNSKIVDTETAYLLGLLTGDGNLSHAGRVGLTSIDQQIISFFKDYTKKYYSSNALTKNDQSYLISSWQFKKYLFECGMSYLLSYDKTIPPTILQAPKDTQKAFLQGLFDTDASVGSAHAEFEYATVSEKMAHQVQMMLLNMGVVATLNQKNVIGKWHKRPVYRIFMTGGSLFQFHQQVGFRLLRKQDLLSGHVEKMGGKSNTNIDIIPNISQVLVDSWKPISEHKLSKGDLANQIDKVRDRNRISREMLSWYVDYASKLNIAVPNLEYLRSLLEANLFFSKVTKKDSGFKRVYDFTVPQTHSFLANGFINHNTLLSRAIAGEASVPFYSIAGSEFMEMLVGVGASRVRDMFATAKKSAPAIIFIDEIESIGRMRGMGMSGGHDEREQTLNQILVEMDGFAPNESVIVIAATNRPDLLDPALVRPGRFDRRVLINLPDLKEREQIIKLHMKGKPFTKDVDIERLARRTVGFSGADLANMLNEAAILAARDAKKEISPVDLEEAATKVKMGPQRRRLQSDRDRNLAAYHEGGHAVVGHSLPLVDPVHRISIVSRGMSGGHTMFPPTEDRSNETKSRLLQQIATALGGRAAEEIIFDDVSTGATNDLQVASSIAREMVTQYGMSDIGNINIKPTSMFGTWRGEEGEPISESLQSRVDDEVKKIIDKAYKLAKELLVKNRTKLDKVAKALLDKETLDTVEFEKIVGKKKTAA
ncbi:ATP-dependent metallopeptidase FtsH/Yme1/Tma family protein [Candidatus Daviesbacteria bacterium]|nr:ATP-dependent metallopeptidase FtsH/Yme1/Tma family protein [Candidatus Daviesbacteria bacterium]